MLTGGSVTGVSVPCVMVSSTYYDLKQVRADLEQFLARDLGYRPLLSEFSSFPVDPDKNTVDNCKVRVEQHADIFVLVIGGRYGSTVDSARSVTNLEYLAARAKGIPIYVFIDKRVLALLPVWESTPDGDFSSAIGDKRVFAFIQEVRAKHSHWTFDFEIAQDIIEILKNQFAHLLKEGIRLRGRYEESKYQTTLSTLSGDAFTLALERPVGWEYLLFSRVVEDEIAALVELKRRYKTGISLGQGEHISLLDIGAWSSPRMQEIQRTVHALDHAINVDFQAAIGAPGEPGDVEHIVSVARLVAAAYKDALEWSMRVRRGAGHECLEPIIEIMAHFPDDIINKVETLGAPLLRQIEDALAVATADNPVTIKTTIDFEPTGIDAFEKALAELQHAIENGDIIDLY